MLFPLLNYAPWGVSTNFKPGSRFPSDLTVLSAAPEPRRGHGGAGLSPAAPAQRNRVHPTKPPLCGLSRPRPAPPAAPAQINADICYCFRRKLFERWTRHAVGGGERSLPVARDQRPPGPAPRLPRARAAAYPRGSAATARPRCPPGGWGGRCPPALPAGRAGPRRAGQGWASPGKSERGPQRGPCGALGAAPARLRAALPALLARSSCAREGKSVCTPWGIFFKFFFFFVFSRALQRHHPGLEVLAS